MSKVIDRGVGEVVLCAAGACAASVLTRILSEEVRCFSQFRNVLRCVRDGWGPGGFRQVQFHLIGRAGGVRERGGLFVYCAELEIWK